MRNIKTVDCPGCGAEEGERCQSGIRDWRWCDKRLRELRYSYSDTGEGYDWQYESAADAEEREQRQLDAERERLRAMTPGQLGREWRRHCFRHDSAVDRCEEINSPTIEDAAGWMRFIETEFKARGIDRWDYTDPETVDA